MTVNEKTIEAEGLGNRFTNVREALPQAGKKYLLWCLKTAEAF